MHNTPRQLTIDPISYATPVATAPEFMRLPRSKERDPIFGLSRGYLNTLILPRRENNYRPPVVSCVLRQRRARTGVRLIDVESLRRYIRKHSEPNSGEETSQAEDLNSGADI
jgi:hypothetical protein